VEGSDKEEGWRVLRRVQTPLVVFLLQNRGAGGKEGGKVLGDGVAVG